MSRVAMNRCSARFITLLLLSWGWAAPAWAVAIDTVVVERVVTSAWLTREGVTSPLVAGQVLQVSDRISSGPQARIYLSLPDGSRIKLGEQAGFRIDAAQLDDAGPFRAAFQVLIGAFRFTTVAIAAVQREREITIRTASSTIGIRGTDVWGRSIDSGELVALIEGRIELTQAGRPISLLPMQVLEVPRGEVAKVRSLSADELARLARETEIED